MLRKLSYEANKRNIGNEELGSLKLYNETYVKLDMQAKYKVYSMSKNLTLDHPSLREQFQSVFAAAREERFEDGMESRFSTNLLELLNQYGAPAFIALGNLIISNKINIEAAAEACRWIGRIENPKTHATRRTLLEGILQGTPYARIRDGAALGLASLDDPISIPILQKAIEQETIPELRQDLQQVLNQLIETQHERV